MSIVGAISIWLQSIFIANQPTKSNEVTLTVLFIAMQTWYFKKLLTETGKTMLPIRKRHATLSIDVGTCTMYGMCFASNIEQLILLRLDIGFRFNNIK
jgi:hypothetical protein